MTKALALRNIPPPTPQIAASLSPQDLREHRAKIASEVKVVLSAYFQPDEEAKVRDAQLSWWCDELQDWTCEQVVYALRQWNRDNPRRRPTPGDISQLLKQIRGRKEAERMRREAQAEQEPTRDRSARAIDPQRKAEADRIISELGFGKRMEADE